MPATFVKLFNSILHSTIWIEDGDTRLVWITMLAMSDSDGIIRASIPGLAHTARVPVAAARAAIAKFMEPDTDSRSKEFEGRRVEECDGGWRLLNHGKYRQMLSLDERREYNRKKQAERRDRLKKQDVNKCQLHVNDSQLQSAQSAHSDSDSDSDSETTNTTTSSTGVDQTAVENDFVKFWNENAGAPFAKIKSWNGKRDKILKTRMKDEYFAANWQEALKAMKTRAFLIGKNDRGWIADVTFFLRPDTVAKIMEGNYGNSSSPANPTRIVTSQHKEQIQRIMAAKAAATANDVPC